MTRSPRRSSSAVGCSTRCRRSTSRERGTVCPEPMALCGNTNGLALHPALLKSEHRLVGHGVWGQEFTRVDHAKRGCVSIKKAEDGSTGERRQEIVGGGITRTNAPAHIGVGRVRVRCCAHWGIGICESILLACHGRACAVSNLHACRCCNRRISHDARRVSHDIATRQCAKGLVPVGMVTCWRNRFVLQLFH